MTAVPGVPEEARSDEAVRAAAEALLNWYDVGTVHPHYGTEDRSYYAAWDALTAAAPILTAAARASGAVEGAAAEREAIADQIYEQHLRSYEGAQLHPDERAYISVLKACVRIAKGSGRPSLADALAVHDQEVAERIARAIEARAEFWGHPGSMAIEDAARIARGGRAEGEAT